MKKTFLITLLILLFISCSPDNERLDLANHPKLTKLISTYYENENVSKVNTYHYSYNNNGYTNKIDITVNYTDPSESDWNRDYTITKYYDGEILLRDVFDHRVNINNRNYTTEIEFTYTNDRISSELATFKDGHERTENHFYNPNGTLNRSEITNGSIYEYSYDTQNKMVERKFYQSPNSNDFSVENFKYHTVLNPFHKTASKYLIQLHHLSEYMRSYTEEDVDFETNDFNLPIKITYSENGVVKRIQEYEY